MSARRSSLSALWRLTRLVGHVLRGLWVIRSEFGRLTPDQTQFVIREWTRRMLDILGVELVVRGTPPARGPLLLVANHISWLDILIMNAAQPTRFVSKADVKRWPLLGMLIDGAGTLYIERESRRDAMRVVHQVAERLRTQDLISVFPEGTTGDGRTLLPFHANILQAAISAGAPVLPVALKYVDRTSGQRSDGPLFIGIPRWPSPSGPRCAPKACGRWCATAHRSVPKAGTAAHGRRTCAPRWPGWVRSTPASPLAEPALTASAAAAWLRCCSCGRR